MHMTSFCVYISPNTVNLYVNWKKHTRILLRNEIVEWEVREICHLCSVSVLLTFPTSTFFNYNLKNKEKLLRTWHEVLISE